MRCDEINRRQNNILLLVRLVELTKYYLCLSLCSAVVRPLLNTVQIRPATLANLQSVYLNHLPYATM